MLLQVLKSILRVRGTMAPQPAEIRQENTPTELPQALLDLSHDPLAVRHLEVLFKSAPVGPRSFLELYVAALRESGTGVPQVKWYRRAQRALHLVRYFEHSLGVDGARAECGVFSGFSALLLCKAAGALGIAADETGFFLIDSFEGLSEIRHEDFASRDEAAGGNPRYARGDMSVSLGRVQAVFRAFPRVSILKGWIPQVFSGLPEGKWSFVHVDVDLFEPTLASLEYFFPRMSRGGVIVNDDYGSPDFPGAGRAWNRFCDANGIPFVVLDTGQAVIMC